MPLPASLASFRSSLLCPAVLALSVTISGLMEDGSCSGRSFALLLAAPCFSRPAPYDLLVLAEAWSCVFMRVLRRTGADALGMCTSPCLRSIFRVMDSCSVAAGIESMLSHGGQLSHTPFRTADGRTRELGAARSALPSGQ